MLHGEVGRKDDQRAEETQLVILCAKRPKSVVDVFYVGWMFSYKYFQKAKAEIDRVSSANSFFLWSAVVCILPL